MGSNDCMHSFASLNGLYILMIWGACLCLCVSLVGGKGLGYSLEHEEFVEVETKLNRP